MSKEIRVVMLERMREMCVRTEVMIRFSASLICRDLVCAYQFYSFQEHVVPVDGSHKLVIALIEKHLLCVAPAGDDDELGPELPQV